VVNYYIKILKYNSCRKRPPALILISVTVLIKGLRHVDMAAASSRGRKDVGFVILDRQHLVCIGTVHSLIIT
jgi:hypothetical protein